MFNEEFLEQKMTVVSQEEDGMTAMVGLQTPKALVSVMDIDKV